MNTNEDFAANSETDRSRDASACPQPLRVWLVDDNDEFRTMLGDFLADEPGIEGLRHFSSPDEVLSTLASKNGPDVIVLDIQMRDRNGLDAIRPIKSLTRSTRVLMLTTFYDSERHSRALNAGASDFLLKSYPPQEIASRIRSPQPVNEQVQHIPIQFTDSQPEKSLPVSFSGRADRKRRFRFFRNLWS